MSKTIAERVETLGYKLPEIAPPVANFRAAVRSGNHVYLSGQIPQRDGGGFITGRLGADITCDDGVTIARRIGLQLLAVLATQVSRVDDVVRVVKLNAYVNCTPDFHEQPTVANGCSDLMVEVLGEAGRHARAAVGVPSLPMDVPVEIDAIFEVRESAA